MNMEWWDWLIVIGVWVSSMWLVRYITAQAPNGELVIFHAKLKEGEWYIVRSVATICLDTRLSKDECAMVQDAGGAYKPFGIILPPKKECHAQEDDWIQFFWRDDKPILHIDLAKRPKSAEASESQVAISRIA